MSKCSVPFTVREFNFNEIHLKLNQWTWFHIAISTYKRRIYYIKVIMIKSKTMYNTADYLLFKMV